MSGKPRLLDLFSGAGGAAMGYSRAGFEVVGVDHKPQKNYPFEFHQADALEFLAEHGGEFDAIHASPPCQKYSQVNRRQHLNGKSYPDLVAPIRALLVSTLVPWIIENVYGAPLEKPVMLCGSAFGLPIRRHRLFESSELLFGVECVHGRFKEKKYPTCFQEKGTVRRKSSVVQVYGNTAGCKLWPSALGIDWMNRHEMTQAIPPAYTHWLGRQLIERLAASP